MKRPQLMILIVIITGFTTSCIGDRKTIIGEDLNDTSFVNKDFKGNAINYEEQMSACEQLSPSVMADLYKVSLDDIIITDPTKSNRYVNPKPSCLIHVKMSDQKFDHLTGGITVYREIKADEYMGDIAEATGAGENWEEAWALKKSMRKSTEWLKGIGQAALWTGKQRKLEVKFEGYTLEVIAPGAAFNTDEQARKRDYKSIALNMAKAAGFIN